MLSLHTSKLDLDLLRVFHVIMSERSVSRAGEQLAMSQSGVSHALARLRELFKDDLLVRSGSSMVPTARALELHDAVKDLFDFVERRILSAEHFDPAIARREFTTAMSDLAEAIALPRLMAKLQKLAPNCSLRNRRIANQDLQVSLESGLVELAFGNVYEPTTNIFQQALYRHEYLVVAWAEHPGLGEKLMLEDYTFLPHVVAMSGSDAHLQNAALGPLGIRRRIALTVDGMMSIPWILPETELIATVPAHLASISTRERRLRSYPLPFEAPPFAIKTYWHPRSQTDPSHRWFRRLAFDVLHEYDTSWAAVD